MNAAPNPADSAPYARTLDGAPSVDRAHEAQYGRFNPARDARTLNARYGKEVIAMATAKTFRPEDLAATLGISGKIVRAYLRKTYTRPASAKGSTWVLSAKQASDTLAYFKKRNPEAYAAAQKKRARKTAPKRTAPKPTESA